MTSELRGVLFHVRERLIQVRGAPGRDQAEAASQPMSVGQAICYLKQAINLELARTYPPRKPPIIDAVRARRGRRAIRGYLEARGEPFNNTSGRIPELIADLLHLAAEFDRGPEPAEDTLRKVRALLDRERGRSEGESAGRAGDV